MNYRHGFHAGNFADVLKHATLALVIEYMTKKPAPFRVIDTHAGAGLYDLKGHEAARTGEWRTGIGKIAMGKLFAEPEASLAPYLSVLRRFNETGGVEIYPGSPLIAFGLMRPEDRLLAFELHDEQYSLLKRHLARYANAKALQLDGYMALRANLPPKERRGVVMIDPPFEQQGEFSRMLAAAAGIMKRFPAAVTLLWYPIKDVREVEKFRTKLAAAIPRELLFAELYVAKPELNAAVSAIGLSIINSTYGLPGALAKLLPFLAKVLAVDDGAHHKLFHANKP